MKEGDQLLVVLEVEVIFIYESDCEVNLIMVQLGMELICKQQGSLQNIFIYCNIGVLVIGGFGIVLGVICVVYLEGLVNCIYVDEIWFWFQGL